MEEKENVKEFENVIKFLEECYIGARMNDDIYMQVRLSRAIAGFISNPNVDYVNLKNSTLTVLRHYGKLPSDIKWVGCTNFKIPIEEFWELADRQYDAGYGRQEVAKDLLVVGENWWLERHEYDGSEWWEYKELPKEPKTIISVPTLFPEKDIGYKYIFLKDFNKNGNYDN